MVTNLWSYNVNMSEVTLHYDCYYCANWMFFTNTFQAPDCFNNVHYRKSTLILPEFNSSYLLTLDMNMCLILSSYTLSWSISRSTLYFWWNRYLPKLFNRYTGADGFLFLQDDMILNYWNLMQSDKNKLWITNKVMSFHCKAHLPFVSYQLLFLHIKHLVFLSFLCSLLRLLILGLMWPLMAIAHHGL